MKEALRFFAIGFVWILSCHPNPDPVSPPPADGGVEDEDAAAKSPCGLACANWKKLHCPEAETNNVGVSCYHVCIHRAKLIDSPTSCWAQAKDVPSLRACGGIRCVP